MPAKISSGTASVKHALIDKTNSRLMITVCVAVALVVFSLVAAKTLWSQAAYQNRVISAKREAVKQLEEDIKIVKELQPSYQAFIGTSTNIIGGNSTGIGPQDGDNAKIVLDALPSRYDFPGLTTDIEQLVVGQGVAMSSIMGVDDELAQSGNASSGTPKPVEMPFNFSAQGDYTQTQQVIQALERSIRPVKVQTIDLKSGEGKITTTISAVSYYQPAKTINVGTKVVK